METPGVILIARRAGSSFSCTSEASAAAPITSGSHPGASVGQLKRFPLDSIYVPSS